MTTKDKTGDRLVASIRKSKTGSVASKTTTSADKDKPAAKPQTDATATVSTASATRKRTHSPDNYSVGRRVWPD